MNHRSSCVCEDTNKEKNKNKNSPKIPDIGIPEFVLVHARRSSFPTSRNWVPVPYDMTKPMRKTRKEGKRSGRWERYGGTGTARHAQTSVKTGKSELYRVFVPCKYFTDNCIVVESGEVMLEILVEIKI